MRRTTEPGCRLISAMTRAWVILLLIGCSILGDSHAQDHVDGDDLPLGSVVVRKELVSVNNSRYVDGLNVLPGDLLEYEISVRNRASHPVTLAPTDIYEVLPAHASALAGPRRTPNSFACAVGSDRCPLTQSVKLAAAGRDGDEVVLHFAMKLATDLPTDLHEIVNQVQVKGADCSGESRCTASVGVGERTSRLDTTVPRGPSDQVSTAGVQPSARPPRPPATARPVSSICRLADPNSKGRHVSEICWFEFANVGDLLEGGNPGSTRDYEFVLPDGSHVKFTIGVFAGSKWGKCREKMGQFRGGNQLDP